MNRKIKIIVSITLLIMFFKYQSLSQFYDRFGVNLILSASKQNIQYYDNRSNFAYGSDVSYLYGVGIGVFYEIYKTSVITTCLNLDYVQRGAEIYIGVPGMTEFDYWEAKTYNRIDYLSFPISLKILLFKNEMVPKILFGLRMDYMISYDTDYLTRYFKEANNLIFGGLMGISFEFRFNEYITLLPSIKYNFDFNNAINYLYRDGSVLNFKNKSIDLSLGVKIK